MAVVKRKSYMIICVILSLLLFILCGCDNTNEDVITDCKFPYSFETDDINIFLDAWYRVQTGDIKRIEEPLDNNDFETNYMIDCLSDREVITIPILKKDSHVLWEISVSDKYQSHVSTYWYTYKLPEEKVPKAETAITVFFSAHEPDSKTPFLDIVEDRGLTVQNARALDAEYNTWYIDTGKGYVSIEFPQTIDATDPSIVYEYFEFETIGIAEYESKMKG